jgi:Cu2+-containing amine oxidase
MTARRMRAGALLAVLALTLWPRSVVAQPFYRASLLDPPAQEVTAEFLLSESGGLEPRKGTAWKVHVARGLHKGLYITGAWFKRDLNEDWIKILNDARVAELFVPYHQASMIRFYDLTGFSFPLAQVREEDAGPFGSLMPAFRGDPYPTVVKEVRDRGVAWKDFAHGVRRGRELVLWAGLEAGNYMYLMSYSFHDDGTIAFRLGATGQNLPGHRFEAHTHSAYWRIDIDLFGGSKNSAMLMRHIEDPESLSAEDIKEPFNGGMEGGVDWDPKAFTMIRVDCDKKNARNETIGYDLMPLRSGTNRHIEEFTRHDLWVSRSHPDRPMEFLAANLPNIVRDEELVEETDIVLWYSSASHHEPRNEDGKPDSAPRLWPFDDAWEGSAIVMWTGFDLRPRNLFDRTPFYPYPPPRPTGGRFPQAGSPALDLNPPASATGAAPGGAAPDRRK